MTTRIYSQEVSHCMFCPNVNTDKTICLKIGLHYRRAVPTCGTPDWCPLPTRWEAYAATVPDELKDSVVPTGGKG